MKKLPYKLKRKLIQINNTARKVAELGEEFDEIIKNEYGINSDIFYQSEFGEYAPLINIINSGDIYDNDQLEKDIKEIEKIFLMNFQKKE